MNKICLFQSSHLKYKFSRNIIHMITNFTFYCRNLQIDRYRLLIGFNTQFHFLTNVKKDCNNWSALAALSRNQITFSFNKPLLGKKILIYSHAYYFFPRYSEVRNLDCQKKVKLFLIMWLGIKIPIIPHWQVLFLNSHHVVPIC